MKTVKRNGRFLMGVTLAGMALAGFGDEVIGEAQVREALGAPVLDAALAGGDPQRMPYRFLTARIAEAGQAIQAETGRLKDRDSLTAWQQKTRAACVRSLGGFPERTPLNARVTGVVARDGYRIEKILFESRPRFFVTALLFLPDAARFAPPYPGVIIPCGHSENGKGMAGYQRGAVLAAVNGMAALLYDPIDQGERLQAGDGKFGCNGHNRTGVIATLLGWNTATFRIWDGMRALDYLASRPEIDAKRLGCMGNSGGGTLTTYISALDERVVSASPSCYISSLQQVCEKIGPQDAEQNLFGQLAFGLEHGGWLLLRAPAATCVCAAQKDFFPIQGTRQTVSEVRSLYARLGAEDRIALVENNGPHGWAEPLRLAAAGWMNRWLRKGGELAVPPETETGLGDKESLVTEQGQVLKLPGARSVYDLMRDEAARLEAGRRGADKQALRGAVRRCAGIRALPELPAPAAVTKSVTPYAGGEIRRLVLTQSGGLAIPAVFFKPAVPQGEAVLVVDGLGKSNAVAQVRALVSAGRAVLAADLCGFGETGGMAHKFYGAGNPDEELGVMAYLLGRSLVGMRSEDILSCARWLAGACGQERVGLQAANWAVTPALHAAVAEPELFSGVGLSQAPDTWGEVVSKGAYHRFSDIVHGALREYDLDVLKSKVPVK